MLNHIIGVTLHKKWSFPLRISSVNVTRSADLITDFVFTSQPNMILHSGFHFSFYLNSHYQIVFAKFNLKVYYPPPLGRQVWRCKYANTAQIKKCTCIFQFLVALSKRRYMFLMKQLPMLWLIMFPMKQMYLMTKICLGWMRKFRV